MADETGARYRFATQEERIIYDDTEANEDDPDWDAVLHALDEHLWGRITQDLSLPWSRFRTVTLVTSIPLCMGSASTALVSRPRSTLRADSTYQSKCKVFVPTILQRTAMRRRSTGRLTRTGWMTSESISSSVGTP